MHLWAEPAASLCTIAGMGRPEVIFTVVVFIVPISVCVPVPREALLRDLETRVVSVLEAAEHVPAEEGVMVGSA